MRRTISSSGTFMKINAVIARSRSASRRSRASAWGSVRGNPSSSWSGCPARRCARRASDRHAVRHELAAARVALGLDPERCARLDVRANMSPVAMCGMPARVAIAVACVPLPEPGGPNIRRSSATQLLRQEALVVPHRQLRLIWPHDAERDADDDQDRGATEAARSPARSRTSDQDVRDDRDDAEEEGAEDRQPRQHAIEVAGRPARTHARMKPPFFFRLSAWSTGLNVTAV